MAGDALRNLHAREQAERDAFKQKLMLVCIAFLFLVAIMAGGIWYYTSTVQNERRAITEAGIKAINTGDYKSAVAYLNAAAEKGESYAFEYLAWLYASSGYYDLAYQNAINASNLSRLSSFEILGDLALINHGAAKGTAAAIAYFEYGAQQLAHEQAQRIRDNEGLDWTTDWYHGPVEGLDEQKIYEHSKELFSAMVQRALPIIGKESDYIDLILRAEKKGASKLELELGDMLFIGNDRLASNAQSALEYWQVAMNKNQDARALTRLAGAAWHGYAQDRDPQKAINLYNEAARQGDPVALYALGLITLRHPKANAATDQAALAFFNKAAELGYGPASTVMGILALTEGAGNRPEVSAAQWLRIAAKDQFDISGRIFYDLLLMAGTGTSKSFAEGFDDLVLVAETYTPAKAILDLLQQRVDPKAVLEQAVILANQVIRGRIAYEEGDPLVPKVVLDPVTLKPVERPFTFYKPIAQMDQNLRARFGPQNFMPATNFEGVTVNGRPLLSADLCKLFIQYAPSTGAHKFDVRQMMPRPLQPRVPAHYTVGDFVPFPTLLEPTLMFDKETGKEHTIF